jgi:uncharacterized membrane protein YedE/YeeE
MSRRGPSELPRVLDGIAGSLLIGLGLLLLGGNISGEVTGGFETGTAEDAFLGLMAIVCGWGAFLLYLAVRKQRDGG